MIEVHQHQGNDYRPLVDCESWRVAVLRYSASYAPPAIDRLQYHAETDEVFVLLCGRCILFAGGIGSEIGEISSIDLEPCKIYNVKKGVWHSHALSKDSTVLIVENVDTTNENSPFGELSSAQRHQIQKQSEQLWKDGD